MDRKLKTSKQICRAYDGHAKAFTKRAVMLHETNLDALLRVQKEGDYSAFCYGANRLAKTGTHRAAILQWMQTHGRCNMNTNHKDGTVSFNKKDKAVLRHIDLDKAAKMPFYADENAEGNTKKDAKSFSLLGILKGALKKAEEIDIDNTGYDPKKVDTGSEDFVAQLTQVLNLFDPADNTNDPPLYDLVKKADSGLKLTG